MKLVFINFVGTNFKGINIYEFLFHYGDVKYVSGEDWDSYPADGNPQPPIEYVNAAYKFETDINFELIQDHESFDMDDCKDGVISMAWEDVKDLDVEVHKRMFFSYGEDKQSVEIKLYERDLYLEKIFEHETK